MGERTVTARAIDPDALTTANVCGDDARVVRNDATKMYAMGRTEASITITACP